MKTILKKWGNSLAVRIPKYIIDDAELQNNSELDIYVSEGKIILRPISKKTFTLDSLLEGINETNIHMEIETGPSIGKEVDL
jgi:antitoxin MazE